MTWDDGRMRSPATRAHVYLPRQDTEGFYWEPRHAVRVVMRAGADQVKTTGALGYSDRDWAILVIPREPGMRAVELARDVPPANTPVALVTMRTQNSLERPCPHVEGNGSASEFAGFRRPDDLSVPRSTKAKR
jgi:hypothetical protein